MILHCDRRLPPRSRLRQLQRPSKKVSLPGEPPASCSQWQCTFPRSLPAVLRPLRRRRADLDHPGENERSPSTPRIYLLLAPGQLRTTLEAKWQCVSTSWSPFLWGGLAWLETAAARVKFRGPLSGHLQPWEPEAVPEAGPPCSYEGAGLRPPCLLRETAEGLLVARAILSPVMSA